MRVRDGDRVRAREREMGESKSMSDELMFNTQIFECENFWRINLFFIHSRHSSSDVRDADSVSAQT